jgi:serine/threonine protein kinase
VLTAQIDQSDLNFDVAASTDTSSNKAAATSLVGTTVDGFVIEGVIGGGAFGTVYRGRQIGLDRPVAMKVPTFEIAADPIMSKRFAREARAAARVNHPGVVAIYGVGELVDGRPYLAMQLLDGKPLDRILVDGPVPMIRALGIARQIASALSETHAAEVVHRDLKPTNIMWRRDRNGDDQITIVDFGIAVCKPGTADATRLTSGGLIGTPHYMSPEQAHGEVVDARADLYALGCLIFELITGVTPYSGSGVEVLLAHLGRPAPRPSEINADIPEAVDQLVLALLAKRPDDRVPSADAAVASIDETLEALEGNVQPPPKPAPRAKRKTGLTKRDRPLPRAAVDGARFDGARFDGIDELAEPAPAQSSDDLAPRPSRARWVAFGAVGALALSTAGFAALHFTGNRGASVSDAAAGASDDDSHDTTTKIVKRSVTFRDDGETRLRVWVPDPLPIGNSRLFLELRNKLGAPIVAEQMIVTIEDPDHKAVAATARPRSSKPEEFGFSHDFKTFGTYHLRVFPPEDAARSPSTFDVELEVAP